MSGSARHVAARSSQLVLGLDPDPAACGRARSSSRAGPDRPAASGGAGAGARRDGHCTLAIEAVSEHCVAVKLQVACFERLGAPGWAALREVAARAREPGLLVIADAKRGDIDVTAAAYAQAFVGETPTPFGTVPGLGADALTVNPLLGTDSLRPWSRRRAGAARPVRARANVERRRGRRAGLGLAGGDSVSDRLAAIVAELGAPEDGGR